MNNLTELNKADKPIVTVDTKIANANKALTIAKNLKSLIQQIPLIKK